MITVGQGHVVCHCRSHEQSHITVVLGASNACNSVTHRSPLCCGTSTEFGISQIPTCARPQTTATHKLPTSQGISAPPAGIEPATFGLGNHCSIRLSYEGGRSDVENCAGGGKRPLHGGLGWLGLGANRPASEPPRKLLPPIRTAHPPGDGYAASRARRRVCLLMHGSCGYSAATQRPAQTLHMGQEHEVKHSFAAVHLCPSPH